MDIRLADLTIGCPRESGTERRTILSPALARALIAVGGHGSSGARLGRSDLPSLSSNRSRG